MEDAHVMDFDFILDSGHGIRQEAAYFGVFDGHSGGEVSKYCATYLGRAIAEQFRVERSSVPKTSEKDQHLEALHQALISSFCQMDHDMYTPKGLQILEQFVQDQADHPELDAQAEALGRFLIERSKRKRSTVEQPVSSTTTTTNPSAPRRRSLTLDGNDLLEVGKSRLSSGPKKALVEESRGSDPEDILPTTTNSTTRGDNNCQDTTKTFQTSAGTTALVLVLMPSLFHENDGPDDQESDDHQLYDLVLANAGDCRAILSQNGHALDLTRDHKPDCDSEKTRILAAGATVSNGRVNGCLNLSRAIGDREFKSNPRVSAADQAITAVPEITIVKQLLLDPNASSKSKYDNELKNDWIFLACDGIFEAWSSQDIADFINYRLECNNGRRNRRSSPTSEESEAPMYSSERILQELFDTCLATSKNGHEPQTGLGLDNMTAILLQW